MRGMVKGKGWRDGEGKGVEEKKGEDKKEKGLWTEEMTV